jgi:hypothetical protein
MANETRYEIHLAPRTWGADEPYLHIPVDIKLVKDDIGRYQVTLRSTSQTLGYVWQHEVYNERTGKYVGKGDWKAAISNDAYYPAGADIMVSLQVHELHRKDGNELEIVDLTSDRRSAVEAILYELADRRADSVEPLIEKARRPFIIAQAEAGQKWAIEHLIEAAKKES